MMTPQAPRRSAFVGRSELRGGREALSNGGLSLVPRLVVGAECRWLTVGRGPRIDIARRGLLRRLLSHLVARRLEHPDVPCPASELIAAGWPGERIPLACAMNRLYVALCYLRKLDLGEVLRNEPEGWCLDGQVEVLREA